MIQAIGKHRVTNASVEHPIVDKMLHGETVDILYSDPPWGDGNMKYWVTMNKKMTGAEYTPISFETLLDRFSGLIKTAVHGHVFIETGVKWSDQVSNRLSGLIQDIRVFRLKYKSGSRILDNVLIYGVTPGIQRRLTIDPSGGIGYPIVRDCVKNLAVPDGIVLDPCCGMGYTARAAVEAGMRFRGNEFNAKRLQKTINFLNSAEQA